MTDDLETISTLIELLKAGRDRGHHPCPFMLFLLSFVIYETRNDFRGQGIHDYYMVSGFIETLLQDVIPIIDDTLTQVWALNILHLFVYLKGHSTIYRERSIALKGDIFAKLPFLISFVDEPKDCYTGNMQSSLILTFSSYLLNSEEEYYRSTVRSHIQDGTVYKLLKMFSNILPTMDKERKAHHLCDVIHAFNCIVRCDKNSIYGRPNHGLNEEFLMMNKVVFENFAMLSFRCTLSFRVALDNIIYHSNTTSDESVIQFYVKQNPHKKLFALLISELQVKDVDYEKLSLLLETLSHMNSLEKYLTIADVRAAVPILPDLINPAKNIDPGIRKPNSFYIIYSIVIMHPLLKENHFNQLKDLNFIPLLVQNAKDYRGKYNDCGIISILDIILYCMYPKHLEKNYPTVRVRDIHQFIPCMPLFIDVIISPDTEVPEEKRKTLISAITMTLVHLCNFKKDKIYLVDATLSALQEIDFVRSIGRAISISLIEKPNLLLGLVNIIRILTTVIDSKVIMRKFLEYLPNLAKRQNCLTKEFRHNSEPEDNSRLSHEITFMFIKAAAFILDEIDPEFVIRVIADDVLCFWLKFRTSEQRAFFASDSLGCKEYAEILVISDEAPVDVLRATWNMIGIYPEIVKEKMPKFSSSDFGVSDHTDIVGLTSSRIVQTVISYLDHSEDYSLSFLTIVTAFVKDLSHNSVSPKRNKLLFRDLMPACERFLEVNNNNLLGENLQYFININEGVIID